MYLISIRTSMRLPQLKLGNIQRNQSLHANDIGTARFTVVAIFLIIITIFR